VAVGNSRGHFSSPLAISGPPAFAGRAAVAGDARGDLVVAWIAADSHGEHRLLWASVRPRGGRFGPRRLISAASDAEQVNVAAGPQGDMVVAFPDKHGHMLARVRRHRGPWGALQNIGLAAGGTENDVTPFVGDTGRIVVAWYETQLCEGGCESPGFVRVAVQPAGKSRFRHEQVLERDSMGLAGAPSGVSLAPAVVALPGGSPLIVFLARGGAAAPTSALTATMVKVSYPRAAAFAPAQTISPEGEQLGDVAAAAGRSGVLVTWIQIQPPSDTSGAVIAAVWRSSSGTFTAPEPVSTSEHAISAVSVFNAASRWPRNSVSPWTVAWTARPLSEASTVVRVSSPVCPAQPSPPAVEPACTGA
jgi:hypothetical protein